MGLLSGAVSISRFNITAFPQAIDFDQASFQELDPNSELRYSHGFVPMEPDQPYEVGARRWCFRVRMDRLRADPTLLRERFRELIRHEAEVGAQFVNAKRRRELREQAEEELTAQTLPASRIIEGCIDGKILYLAGTAKAHLGVVAQLLREIGVQIEPKSPWVDRGDTGYESSLIPGLEPGQSVLGCRLLKELIGDSDATIAEDNGYVKIQTLDTKVTLSGSVLHDVMHYIELDSEILAANMVADESTFRFDALSFRINNLKVETGKHEHWTGLLDERLEKIAGVFEILDRKFIELGVDLSM